jgi:hypothetical protein
MGKLGARFVVIIDPTHAFDIDDMAALCESSASKRVAATA